MKLIKIINQVLKKFNAQIVRHPSPDITRRLKIMNYYKINKVIDVGANVGNYSKELFQLGYNGQIISFEPLSSAFKKLKDNSKSNSKWSVFNCALGDFDGKHEINISENSDSSSLLPMLPDHLNSAPDSKYISKEEIEVKKLDTIFDEITNHTDNIYLKIDTQGFEKSVLNGAISSIKKIKAIQIELSIIPLYESSFNYKDLMNFLEQNGFKLVSIENGFSNPLTGELLQFDGVFIRQ
ncbi:MAG: FkbM family methyltransferase [Sphingobacteriaceae bacterium]|jgi:FkbM family methyltransferase